MKINLPLPMLSNEDLHKLDFHYLDFRNDVLVYRLAYKADADVTIIDYSEDEEEPEEYSGKKKINQDQTCIRRKVDISGIDVDKEEFGEEYLHSVTLHFNSSTSLAMFFKASKDAHKFKDILAKYWLENKLPEDEVLFS